MKKIKHTHQKVERKKSNFIKKIMMESKLYPFFTAQEEDLEEDKPEKETLEEDEDETSDEM